MDTASNPAERRSPRRPGEPPTQPLPARPDDESVAGEEDPGAAVDLPDTNDDGKAAAR